MKKKYPWYVWLSALGFAYQVVTVCGALARNREEGGGESRCLPFLGWSLYLFAGQVLLPAVLVMGVWRRIAWPSLAIGELTLLLAWALIYAAGVIAAIRLDRWVRQSGK